MRGRLITLLSQRTRSIEVERVPPGIDERTAVLDDELLVPTRLAGGDRVRAEPIRADGERVTAKGANQAVFLKFKQFACHRDSVRADHVREALMS